MGWNQEHWHPETSEGRDPDDIFDDDCGGALNYFMYGGGIIVIILLVLVLLKLYFKLWVYCVDKNRHKNGRVIAQPPPQEPVKPTPPPYSSSEYDNPPPYHVCVPDVYHQPPVAGGSGDITGSHNATTASAPTKHPSPEPQIQTVAMPRY